MPGAPGAPKAPQASASAAGSKGATAAEHRRGVDQREIENAGIDQGHHPGRGADDLLQTHRNRRAPSIGLSNSAGI